jgi:hypothetical protein
VPEPNPIVARIVAHETTCPIWHQVPLPSVLDVKYREAAIGVSEHSNAATTEQLKTGHGE